MASKKPEAAAEPEEARDLAVVEVDGVEVVVDTGYVRSWKGIRQAGLMASSELSEQDRIMAMLVYYEAAVGNMDEVTAEIGERDPKEAVALLSRAVKAATSKN